MEVIILLIGVGTFTFILFSWIFGIDIKATIFVIIGIVIGITLMIYLFNPEINLKFSIVKENNKYTTLKKVNELLSKEEAQYYKLAILTKPEECKNRTVNWIINLGRDISESININNYIK